MIERAATASSPEPELVLEKLVTDRTFRIASFADPPGTDVPGPPDEADSEVVSTMRIRDSGRGAAAERPSARSLRVDQIGVRAALLVREPADGALIGEAEEVLGPDEPDARRSVD